MSIPCHRESIPCYRGFFFASCDSQPTSSCTDGGRALQQATAWGGDWHFRPAGAFGRTECISAMRLMRLRRVPFRGRSRWMSSGVHISGNQAVEYHCPATGKARGSVGFMLHFLRCKLFAERQTGFNSGMFPGYPCRMIACDWQSSRFHCTFCFASSLLSAGIFPVTKRWHGHGWHANEPRADSSRRRTAHTARLRGMRVQSALVGCTLARRAPLPPTSAPWADGEFCAQRCDFGMRFWWMLWARG